MSDPVILSKEARSRIDLAFSLMEKAQNEGKVNDNLYLSRVIIILAKLLDDADYEIRKAKGEAP